MASARRPSLVQTVRARQHQGLFPVISEIKLRSPKAGDLLRGRDPLSLVQEMATCPVAGISVVTEPFDFGGSMGLLREVTTLVSLPVLHKDFIEDVAQVKASARSGASAILLIASRLDDSRLTLLIHAARKYGLEALVEVHTVSELERIRHGDFDLLGINNRDIRVLEVDDTDVEQTATLARYYEGAKPLISESAISSPDEVRRVGRAGADAVLVGTAVMRAPNLALLLKQLIWVGWPV